jgi:hypothetical protein
MRTRRILRRFALWLLSKTDPCVCGLSWTEHRCAEAGFNVCGICGKTLAKNALRTADGHYRCAAHKGVVTR